MKNVKFGETVSVEIFRNNIKQTYQVKFPSKDEIILLTTDLDKLDNKDKNHTQPNIEEKLESLQRLLNKGIINKDEYEIKKKQLLKEL